MNTQILVDSVVQQTVVFIAQLATAGGLRAPLAHIANEVFLGLIRELQTQGVKKNVIADMFGMALRTYHRRVRELGRSRTGHRIYLLATEHAEWMTRFPVRQRGRERDRT